MPKTIMTGKGRWYKSVIHSVMHCFYPKCLQDSDDYTRTWKPYSIRNHWKYSFEYHIKSKLTIIYWLSNPPFVLYKSYVIGTKYIEGHTHFLTHLVYWDWNFSIRNAIWIIGQTWNNAHQFKVPILTLIIYIIINDHLSQQRPFFDPVYVKL